jgi:hypothetical protein
MLEWQRLVIEERFVLPLVVANPQEPNFALVHYNIPFLIIIIKIIQNETIIYD